jgi:hypothetical protein
MESIKDFGTIQVRSDLKNEQIYTLTGILVDNNRPYISVSVNVDPSYKIDEDHNITNIWINGEFHQVQNLDWE